MGITYHWLEMPAEVAELSRRLAAKALPTDEEAAARARRRALVSTLRCEFGLSHLARLGTVRQMERLGMLVGPAEPPYPALPWDDTQTDRHAFLSAHDPPASGGMGRWKFVSLGGGLVYPDEIAAALAAVSPEEHERASRQVVWWPGFVAFLRGAQAHGGFFT